MSVYWSGAGTRRHGILQIGIECVHRAASGVSSLCDRLFVRYCLPVAKYRLASAALAALIPLCLCMMTTTWGRGRATERERKVSLYNFRATRRCVHLYDQLLF